MEKQTRNLPVKLKEDEVAAKSQELAASIRILEDMEITLKSVSKKLKDDITAKNKEVLNLARIVTDKIEYRDVECYEYRNLTTFTVEIIRFDTSEIVATRPMTQNERQLVMFPEKKLRRVNESESADNVAVAPPDPPADPSMIPTAELEQISQESETVKENGNAQPEASEGQEK